MTSEKRAELLLGHHKDTFQNIVYQWKLRNRLFIFVLLLLAIMALDTYSPDSIAQLLNDAIAIKLNKGSEQTVLEFRAIGSAIWFLFLTLVIGYYQRSISVDRQYHYIDQLERQICAEMGGRYITREGKAYSSKTGAYIPDEIGRKPLFLRMVGPLYTYFFPLTLTIFVSYRLYQENQLLGLAKNWFNNVIGLIIIAYNILYVLWVVRRI